MILRAHYKLRNTASCLRFSSVTYDLYAPVGKSAHSLSCSFLMRACIAARLAASSACALAHLRIVNSRRSYSIKLAICTTLQARSASGVLRRQYIYSLPLGGKVDKAKLWTNEGRSPFVIETFRRKISIKGCNLFSIQNFFITGRNFNPRGGQKSQ